MSADNSKSPDVAALLPVLAKIANLCRKLDLPKEAAVYDRIAARFRKKPPSWKVATAQVSSSFMDGFTVGAILNKLGSDAGPFCRIDLELAKITCPDLFSKTKKNTAPKWKAIRKSKAFWELTGESELHAVTIPDPPREGRQTKIRLTHSNPYGPLDKVKFFVRIGNDKHESATEWVEARLVEELVYVDDEEMLRSKAKMPIKGEIPWDGTYDAELVLPKGRHVIEIKIESRHRELRSLILRDWDVSIGPKQG